ncbi:cytochrome c biogenesis protein ResB [Chengkuizengella axinellae]|uniref:Cytochrome c biogenesis protein ResB n=1 Tax=Chengkuizengella axinellae TaxID=3064388 RepID=A0ABT9IWR4_9BACL|nr:cytochrome c biogenesis protein ResB [Chengkuizengella sp. 2205SS18-9]MDP5273762.1 cytochrome c biogenesis protein ResB [Chengkuizengella sp. 2205SS18-9]
MIQNTKCECGHQNPVNTVLCESCGKPLIEDQSMEPLEMRYDGVVRRSQRGTKSVIDVVWSFFSSVKVAIYLIFLTLCGASLGTIYPQENTFINIDPATYYPETYGTMGEIYYTLGLSHTYDSWWFKLLLIMIGTSLVICSLDRVLPLYKALSKQKIRKHERFISRQKIVYTGEIKGIQDEKEAEKWVEEFSAILKKKFYRVTTDGSALLAEKNRFSRWGPYINHIGLIIFLLAVLLRIIVPGWYMEQYMDVLDGDTVQVPGTNYYVENEGFTVEYYSEDELAEETIEKGKVIPELFETKAVLYECVENCNDPFMEPILEEVTRHPIQVNKPLKYNGLLIYQMGYEETPLLRSVNATLKGRESGEEYGQFVLEMDNPKSNYEVGEYQLELVSYYPDFKFENGVAGTKSSDPNTPAFIFSITGPGLPDEGEINMYFPIPQHKVIYQEDQVNEAAGSTLVIDVGSMQDVDFSIYTSFLSARKDTILPMIWVGAAISMIGLIMGFYWNHRRIWIRMDGKQLLLGAHSNKNWFGLRKEVALALEKQGIKVEPKSLENEVKKS